MPWTEPVGCLCICNGYIRLDHTCAQLPRRGHTVGVDGIKKRVPVTRYTWVGSDRWQLAGGCARSIAGEQRAFGEGQLLVALAGPDSYLHTLLRTPMTEPPELALAVCLTAVKRDIARDPGPTVAVAFSDEEDFDGGSCPPDLAERCQRAVHVAAACGVHLAEWIQCSPWDHCALGGWSGIIPAWWDVPGSPWEDGQPQEGVYRVDPRRDESYGCPRCCPDRWRAPAGHHPWDHLPY